MQMCMPNISFFCKKNRRSMSIPIAEEVKSVVHKINNQIMVFLNGTG